MIGQNLLAPQIVRGGSATARISTANAAFQTVLNIAGQGKITQITGACLNAGDTLEVRVTIDGTVWITVTHTGDLIQQVILSCVRPNSNQGRLVKIAQPLTVAQALFDIEFDTSAHIELRRSAGANNNVECTVLYNLDNF